MKCKTIISSIMLAIICFSIYILMLVFCVGIASMIEGGCVGFCIYFIMMTFYRWMKKIVL